MDGLFDRVLKLRGLRHVIKQNEGDDMAKCMRGVYGGIWILLMQILVLILTLPVNFIPILGQIIFITINGWILTFGLRFHYDVEIRNITVMQSRSEAWKRKPEFVGFGSVAFALEMIPLANILFVWTNIIGSALWVADEIERDQALLHLDNSTQSLMVGQQVPMHHIPLSDTPPEYTPGNHIHQEQQQQQQQTFYAPTNQNQYYQSQPQVSYHYQSSSSHNDIFSNQGSAMIPPKNKKHPEV
ncbi:hypothetical protein BGZ76_003521 [Entomortierella beljakovae]|nr:hypothetical protein BGZ76_003521 [Entomortierella beljakovae]